MRRNQPRVIEFISDTNIPWNSPPHLSGSGSVVVVVVIAVARVARVDLVRARAHSSTVGSQEGDAQGGLKPSCPI